MQMDYDSIVTDLQERLSLLSGWARVLFFGVYQRIIDAVAYIVEKLGYLTEVYYRESVWSTAQKRDSLIKQSPYLNYNAPRSKGASGYANILGEALDSSDVDTYVYTGVTVPLPKWTQLTDTGNQTFVYTTEEAVYANGQVGILDVAVKEGKVKTYTYQALGNKNEVISIASEKIDNDELQVDIVDSLGNVISEVNICGQANILSGTLTNPDKLRYIQDKSSYYCEVSNSPDFQKVNFTFGDDIYGKKLQLNTLVKITYAETLGTQGNILLTDTIVKFVNNPIDANGNQATLYVTNQEEISNGSDSVDLETIRTNGPNLFVSGYRCGSDDDWKTILQNHNLIYKANVSYYEDLGLSGLEFLNKVFVTAVSRDGSVLTDAEKAQVVVDLKAQKKKGVTDLISWYDPNIIFLLFDITATVEDKPFTVIDAGIKNALNSKYGILSVDFAQNVYSSDYISFIKEITYILHHDTEVYQMEANVTATCSLAREILVSYTALDTTDPTKQIYLQRNTLQLWIRRKRNGTWDSTPYKIAEDVNGTITGLAGDLSSGIYTIAGSYISYGSNRIAYTVSTITGDPTGYGIRNPQTDDLTGYILYLAYKTQDGNGEKLIDVRFPNKSFITNIDSNFIFTDLAYNE